MLCPCRYTPFTTPSLLAEQINVLGTHSGTRLVFWDLRDDLDGLAVDGADGMLYLSSAPDLVPAGNARQRGEEETDAPSREATDGRRALTSDTNSSEAAESNTGDAGEGATSSTPNGEAAESEGGEAAAPNGRDFCRPVIDRDAHVETRAGPQLLDVDEDGRPLDEGALRAKTAGGAGGSPNASLSLEKSKATEEASCGTATSGRQPKTLPPLFPLWTCAKHSPDFCLATYLYWLHLHSPATIQVQGIPLVPQQAALEKKGCVSAEASAPAPAEEAAAKATKDSEMTDPLLDNRPALHGAHSERRTEAETLADLGGSSVKSLKMFLKRRLYACVSGKAPCRKRRCFCRCSGGGGHHRHHPPVRAAFLFPFCRRN